MAPGVEYVRQALAAVVGADVVAGIPDDVQFLDRGLIDSLQIVEIIGYLEDDRGVEVAGEDLTPENFGSISGMARFLVAKRAI